MTEYTLIIEDEGPDISATIKPTSNTSVTGYGATLAEAVTDLMRLTGSELEASALQKDEGR